MVARLQIGEMESKQTTRLRLRVKGSAEQALRSGHPWLFSESIREQNREGQLGEFAVVYDRNDRFLALGLFDPESPIRVRILQAGKRLAIDDRWWAARLELALERRRGLFDDQTTGYRCIHGESDGWPGLVLDRYARSLVLKLYTAAWLPRLAQVVPLLVSRLNPERLLLRLSRNIQSVPDSSYRCRDGQILHGAPIETQLIFQESGLCFEADVVRGQKTGFFLDQRENRRRIGTLARGSQVLNAFSYSSGFSLYAARGGAHSVTDLDISSHALDSGRRNFALNRSDNRIAASLHELIQADAFEWLSQSGRRRFDLIILDPPSLARRESERQSALKAYGHLALSALAHLRPGGILLGCSCSAHVTAEEFFAVVRRAAARSGRKFVELETTRHPPDHPAAFPEAEYLKAIYLKDQSN
jgi:23S rRNA (cytosine1962-C5)-methyltransferase